MNRNFILEVKNIRPCPGGHSCSLNANGRKVAYVAPDVFEWTSHRAMVDVLEFYGKRINVNVAGPIKLEDNWMEKDAPSTKKLDIQEMVQQQLFNWINEYVEKYLTAKAIKDKCKNTILTGMKIGDKIDILDYYRSPSFLKNSAYRSGLIGNLADGEVLLNTLGVDEIIELLA